MSTPLEKVNPKPAKVLGHDVSVPGQNGVPDGASLVIVIWVSPTAMAVSVSASSKKVTGIVGGGVSVVIPIEFT